MVKKKKILIFTGYYLPGYRAGGPVKSIKNVVDNLHGDFDFYIVTRNNDLGCHRYENTFTNGWYEGDGCKIRYLNTGLSSLLIIYKLIKKTSPDVIYINSFFDFIFSIWVIILRKFRLFSCNKIILAPRGEFSKAALSLGRVKKAIYIRIAKKLKLYQNVLWQCSTIFEKKDVLTQISNADIHIAKDLPSVTTEEVIFSCNKSVKVLFLSRISPMKNLNYALDILNTVKEPITFDIYGPIEDLGYWETCCDKIKQLPSHITVEYKGEVVPNHVPEVMGRYDLFFLPTRGENYGHVIAESLLVGTPVLISDRTPWRGLEAESMGWDLALEDREAFANCLNRLSKTSVDFRHKIRETVLKSTYIKNVVAKDIEDNFNLLNC